MYVQWTTGAKTSFNQIIEFMYLRWSDKEVARFVDRTDEIVDHICQNPYSFKQYESEPSIRHGILHQNVTLFYRIIKQEQLIELLFFWDNRQDPSVLKLR